MPADPTPISCLGLRVRGEKEKGKEFYQIFSRGERTPPFDSLPHGEEEEEQQPWGPLTNPVVPSVPCCRANPAGTTFVNARLQQHSCLADKETGASASFSYPFGSTSWASSFICPRPLPFLSLCLQKLRARSAKL
jgi:hypothetical protein